MHKFRKTAITAISLLCATVMFGGVAFDSFKWTASPDVVSAENLRKLNSNVSIYNNLEEHFDGNVVQKLSDNVSEDQAVSLIVSMNTESVLSAYNRSGKALTVSEYTETYEARKISNKISNESAKLIAKLDKSGIEYELGERYDTLLSGFEITVKGADYANVCSLMGNDATVIVGESYLPAATTQIILNKVEVDETGIFDSSFASSSGEGVVVAVLDSGLDYTHSAFSLDGFNSDNLAFTKESISKVIADTTAATLTEGLTADDVYVSAKIPFAYDYADKDTDVLPTNSDHGTHVSGIIAGSNNEIVGVAPNAQIAFMKVFSDLAGSAKSSWIVAGLEDCVNLGVDVINMSLGSACGFATERDRLYINEIYDRIKEVGISLVVAAGNDGIATTGSEKNGALNLTSNPDAGTVGAPSTYHAALSVASVDGVLTPYLEYDGQYIYFDEATDISAETLDFVDIILDKVGEDVQSHAFTYVTIPGLGRSSDYSQPKEYYKDKIVLVKRGTLTFEDKIKVALKEKEAAGIIIYNNVSGQIRMSIGKVNGAACSISQDDGELLAASETGTIIVSRNNVAGPFMSDFSGWGPTSGLEIKPEITAHGGEIYSCIPGEAYERQSGTSMAAPNQAGATALVRERVKYEGSFGTDMSAPAQAVKVTNIVNQLMMSTTDIVINKNGLPFAVRKQGAGLMSIKKALSSNAYLTTYDRNGNVADKAKFELGDDKAREGVYRMTFDINNVGTSALTYDVGAIVMTEGVSETYTGHDDTTVNQEGYLLNATTTVLTIGGAPATGNTVTVKGKSSTKVCVEIKLSDEDKKYIDDNFKYGMYVEGFITLTATAGTEIGLNAPFLGYFGDWTEPPIFDEEYYDTHKDEVNDGLDVEDKLMADTYATRVIGKLYNDYISIMGAYAFNQNPSATQLTADKKYIAMSNQESDVNSALNAISGVWAGLLRNARSAKIKVVEDATGEVIWTGEDYNIPKSRSGGSSMMPTPIDIDFSALANNLKNNSRYTVTVETYIDYGEDEDQKNKRNVFSFPIFIDFESPLVSDVQYRSEYDKNTKKTRLYADFYVYDNHYAMGLQLGQITKAAEGSQYMFDMTTFGKYITPVYSSFNSTSKVTIELTDYINDLKKSATIKYSSDGTSYNIVENSNTMIAICYDYALNAATYELTLPSDFLHVDFTQDELTLNPNETKDLTEFLDVYPSSSWLQTLNFTSSDPDVVDVVNQTVIAKTSGSAVVTVIGRDADGNEHAATVQVNVLAPGDEGYQGNFTIPKVNKFQLTSYKVNKAFYSTNSEEREIGLTGTVNDFAGEYTLNMFPSENITLISTLDSYFMDRTSLSFQSSNRKVATVNEFGVIEAKAEGTARITVTVMFDGSATSFLGVLTIKVKDPWTTNALYLTSYKGLGGEVTIPSDRGIKIINSFAFSNYEYVAKGSGDVIDDEDPYTMKQWYIGDNTITKVIIPEGVKEIASYAFANLTALEEVVLPSTLTRIGVGAFYGCRKLKTVNFEYVKFINAQAFEGTGLNGVIDFTGKKLSNGETEGGVLVAISDYAFRGCKLTKIILPKTAQSIGIGSFASNTDLSSIEMFAPKVKIGENAFYRCTSLKTVDINAAVISPNAFRGCTNLTTVNLGRDVSVIGENAFNGTNVSKYNLDPRNTNFTVKENGAMLFIGNELVSVAPMYQGKDLVVDLGDTEFIGKGAFSGNTKIVEVIARNVKSIGDYAFSGCTQLKRVTFDTLVEIGDYAFESSGITSTPDLSSVTIIGKNAFYNSKVTTVDIKDGTIVGEYAFAFCNNLTSVNIGANVIVKDNAFLANRYYYLVEDNDTISNLQKYYTSYVYEVKDENGNVVEQFKTYTYDLTKGINTKLTYVSIGSNTVLGEHAFEGHAKLTDVEFNGEGAVIGAYAFYDNCNLVNVNLSTVASVGDYAFSGTNIFDITHNLETNQLAPAIKYNYVDGQLVPVEYLTISAATKLITVDLSKATAVGAHAFEGVKTLTGVKFGDNLATVSDNAFAVTGLTKVEMGANVTAIGDYAFYQTNVTAIDLSNVDKIGNYAFRQANITEITLKDGATVGNYAFDECETLATVNGLENVLEIGAYAFADTAITEVNFVKTEKVGEFAFMNSAVTKVTFGNDQQASALKKLGDNPFAQCEIDTYAKTVESAYGLEIVYTYDVNDNVKVIDGVLYEVISTGLELVSYPKNKVATNYIVVGGTARISARAFEGANLYTVKLSAELLSIGHKAFYGCNNLTTVVFASYEAPLLEEEYDLAMFSTDNIPFTGTIADAEGLGISNYYMWNIGTSPNAFYYGANFVTYVGKVSRPLVMVKPVNGKNYDSFIFGRYFSTVVDGSSALMDSTLEVIALIENLPTDITLDDEAKVVEARTAYDRIASLEQKSLVSNYAKLTSAESLVAYLKQQQKPDQPDEPDQPDNPGEGEVEDDASSCASVMPTGGNTTGGMMLLIVAGLGAFVIVSKKRANK